MVAIVATAIAVVVSRTDRSGGVARPTRSSPPPASASPLPRTAEVRFLAIRALLRRRAAAVEHHHLAPFLATVDPLRPAFRRQQAQLFRNLARVPIASWAYQMSALRSPLQPRTLRRYGGPTWAPAYFSLRYRLAGFDTRPTDRRQYPTFVERSGRWYLGSLSDFARYGRVSATDLWDYGPVDVVKDPRVLVLGPPTELATMTIVANVVSAAIPKVTAVWGPHWARRAVVMVPATQHEMGLINSDSGDLDQIAALTSAEVQTTNGRPAPVGDRITINPANWPKLGALGAAVVITHELTHVATRAATGTQTPKWLSEGFAEYVSFHSAGVSTRMAAAELGHEVQAGELPSALPADRAFRGSAANLGAVYQSAWLACGYIADRYGQAMLVRFYRTVGTSPYGSRAAVRTAMRQLLDTTVPQFVAAWRGYIREQLG